MCQRDQPSTGAEGNSYHLVRLRGIDPVQDALHSVQLGMQGLNALLRPLLGLEGPQRLGWEGDVVRLRWGRPKGLRQEPFPDGRTTPGLFPSRL